jgi:hypothetical protein
MAESTNPVTGQTYYAGDVEDIKALCRILKIGDGRLSQITPSMVERYMGLSEDAINALLAPHYFLPIRPYRHVKADELSTATIFPPGLRSIAQRWTAGLMLTSEFQDLEPNANESASKYVEESRNELVVMLNTNTRIQGQIPRTSFARTMPPGMMPTKSPEVR